MKISLIDPFLVFALTALVLLSAALPKAQEASWITNSPMNCGRKWHTATLLPSGKLVVAGGVTSDAPPLPCMAANVEMYDPDTGHWSAIAPMTHTRALHTATLLPSGQMLIAGGNDWGAGTTTLASAELYDPATDQWTATGSMTIARADHRAVLLRSGKVLVVGGGSGSSFLSSADLYDPATGTWTTTGTPLVGQQGFTLTLLTDRRVLMAAGADGGGHALDDVELYNPDDGTWTATTPVKVPRLGHTATLLPNGLVLIAGGVGANLAINSAELFNPAAGTWILANPMGAAHCDHTASLLPDGYSAAWRESSRDTGFTYRCQLGAVRSDRGDLVKDGRFQYRSEVLYGNTATQWESSRCRRCGHQLPVQRRDLRPRPWRMDSDEAGVRSAYLHFARGRTGGAGARPDHQAGNREPGMQSHLTCQSH